MSSSVGNTPKESRNLMPKVVQTAGRDALGTFAPQFAALNDDVLFGEVWSSDELTLKMRSILTVTTLVAKGMADGSFEHHVANAKKNGVTAREMAAILTHVAFYAGWPNAWAAFRVALKVYAAGRRWTLKTPRRHERPVRPHRRAQRRLRAVLHGSVLPEPVDRFGKDPVHRQRHLRARLPQQLAHPPRGRTAAARSCSSPTARAGTKNGASLPARSSPETWCISQPT